ncbi:hypothetical protein P2W50_31380 [Pseudomonas protegens]|uniref:hypothetical protein n=1 Tax=Pseudomonas protegens TaxID=380021 RepID=UPI0023EAB563|nr:hypothetical protein [Pseudomonas protegens]MDF4211156.1 hypothetical protein [Pseudomonas protegens]
MKKFIAVAFIGFLLTGCQHIQDLRACQPPQKSPEPFTDAGGWDHRSVDEVRCTNEELKAVVEARERREAEALGAGRVNIKIQAG